MLPPTVVEVDVVGDRADSLIGVDPGSIWDGFRFERAEEALDRDADLDQPGDVVIDDQADQEMIGGDLNDRQDTAGAAHAVERPEAAR